MQDIGILLLGALLVAAFYWSFVALPRRRIRRQKDLFLRSLSAGDEVVTFGGILGNVVEIDDDDGVAHVEIAEQVVIRVVTDALVQRTPGEPAPEGEDAAGEPG